MPGRWGPREAMRPPRIVWTDLVIRVPLQSSEAAPKEMHKAAFAAAMKQHPGSEGQNLGQRTRRRRDRSQGGQDCTRGAEAEDRRNAKPLAGHPRKSAPENSSEKGAVRTILVDLRPILEETVDLSESSAEMLARDLQKDENDRQVESGDLPVEGGGPHAPEMVTPGPMDPGVHEDTLPPHARDPFRTPGAHIDSTHGAPEIFPQVGDLTELQETTLPAALTPDPELQTAVASPNVEVQEPGGDPLLQSIEPPTSLPDLHLPTRLLLQRLQETTTSRHHSLIAQVLASLREEILDQSQPPLGGGHKEAPLLQLPSFNVSERKKDGEAMKHLKPGQAVAGRMLGKFTWRRCHRSGRGAGLAPQAPGL